MNVFYFTRVNKKLQLSNRLDFANIQDQNYLKLLFFQTKGEYTFKNCQISANPGKLLLIDPSYRLSNLEQLQGTGWLLFLDLEMLMETFMTQYEQPNKSLSFLSFVKLGEKKIKALEVPPEKIPNWIMRFSSLKEEQSGSLDYSAVATRAILKLLMVDLVRLSSKESCIRLPYCDPLLNRVFNFIESHYAEAISLSDVAKEVNKTTSYLTNLVRQKTGKTVLQWITEFRMAKARCLIIQTDLAIEKIAEAVGYQDTRHFSRQFSRIHGSSPRKWQSLQSGNSLANEKANARLNQMAKVML